MANCDVLFIRMDKLGDLILSLPVDQQDQFEKLNTHWFISKGMSFVLDKGFKTRKYTSFDKSNFSELKRMRVWLRLLKPKSAVLFYAPWWVGLALYLEKVPVRIGRRSQWHSFLFFNKGLRQKRSRGEKHELEYNIELLNTHFQETTFNKDNFLKFKPPKDKKVLEKFNLKEKSYIIIHPGMAGSALNWPNKNYIELCEKLKSNTQVVITGTAADKKFIDPLKEHFQGQNQILFVDGKCNGEELIELCQFSSAVVAPSTGVVHIAASSGTKTIGLYSPIATQSAKRWGSLGNNVKNIEAPTKEPLESSMEYISVDQILDHLA